MSRLDRDALDRHAAQIVDWVSGGFQARSRLSIFAGRRLLQLGATVKMADGVRFNFHI